MTDELLLGRYQYPFHLNDFDQVEDGFGVEVGIFETNDDIGDRFTTCVNALAGIQDPTAFVQAARAVFACLEWAEGTGLLEHGGMGEMMRKDLAAFRTQMGEA